MTVLNTVDAAFADLYARLIQEGHVKSSRTGINTHMLPAQTMRSNLRDGRLPAIATKELRFKKSFEEMCWFITGDSNIKYLRDRKNGIWDSWFIPGTAVYNEPAIHQYSIQERIDLAIDAGYREPVRWLITLHQTHSGELGSTHLTLREDGGELTEFNNLPEYFIRELHRELTGMHVPTQLRTGGGKPVSLKVRLGRLDLKKTGDWRTLHRIASREFVVEEGKVYGPKVKVDIHDGRKGFTAFELYPEQVERLHRALDGMKVPAYPLLSADIGPGGYGPGWRHWQDTQLVEAMDLDLVKAYKAQGYTNLGGPTRNYDLVVMTREVDQLQNAINMLVHNPDDRRIIVTAWNPGLTWRAALPPCHLYFQFMTTWRTGAEVLADMLLDSNRWPALQSNYQEDSEGILLTHATFIDEFNTNVAFREHVEAHLTCTFQNKFKQVPTRDLHCLLVMRSSDAPLGLPFNIAQYSLLVHAVANVVNMTAASLTWVAGDCHIYANQIEAIKEQLTRSSPEDSEPRIRFTQRLDSIDDLTPEMIEVTGYTSQPFLDVPVAV